VINEARTQGLDLSTVRQENGKLMLRGTAPSQEAADKVWAEIRRVDPGRQDIVADFSVEAAAHDSTATDKVARIPDDNTTVTRDKPEASEKPDVTTDKSTTTVTPMPLEKPAADDSKPRSYTVKAGDTLGTISKEFYGTTKDYGKILEANRNRINDPNVIHVGEELTIP
jgi:nucleoid-associated protein YgaU